MNRVDLLEANKLVQNLNEIARLNFADPLDATLNLPNNVRLSLNNNESRQILEILKKSWQNRLKELEVN